MTIDGQSWSDVFKGVFATGVNAYVDSQVARNYGANDPQYNTEGGIAGTDQSAAAALSSFLPWLLLGGAAILGVLLLKRAL